MYLHGKHPFFDCFTFLRVRLNTTTVGNLAVGIAAFVQVLQSVRD